MSADIQGELYENGIDTVARFAAAATDEADLKAMLKDSFSINPSESLKLRAQAAGVVVAWKTAISRVERQAEAEATNEVRDLAKPIPSTDYIAMRQAFAAKFGELEDKHIPAKEYIEKKLAELESGEFRAEPLTEIISSSLLLGRYSFTPSAWTSSGPLNRTLACPRSARATSPGSPLRSLTLFCCRHLALPSRALPGLTFEDLGPSAATNAHVA